MALYIGFDEGQCEVCEEAVRESDLKQCHLGFCGTFLCQSCSCACSCCISDDVASQWMGFCVPCANKVVPKCIVCNERFCGKCTSFTKCSLCTRLTCLECHVKDEMQLRLNNRCKLCMGHKDVMSLQGLCRDAIRKYIACNISYTDGSHWTCAHPTDCINECVNKLCLPKFITDILKVSSKWRFILNHNFSLAICFYIKSYIYYIKTV